MHRGKSEKVNGHPLRNFLHLLLWKKIQRCRSCGKSITAFPHVQIVVGLINSFRGTMIEGERN